MATSRDTAASWIARSPTIMIAGASVIAASGFGMGAAVGSWTRACAGGNCPSIAVLDQYRPRQSSKIYAADGRLVADLGADLRTVRRLENMTPALRAAFVAVEDKRFFEHNGVDLRRVLGAVIANFRCLCFREGFSTITMQLARNVFPERLPSTKQISRKVREVLVARELERTYTKERILELYLNQIYLGYNWYGVETASQRYFGKSSSDLNVAEAALLAAVANVPNFYNPLRYPDRAVRRRNTVINLMRNQGFLGAPEAERWKAYPLELSSRRDYSETAPYFVEWVRRELFARFGQNLYEQGYRVYTTLDLDMQAAAERALSQQLARIEGGDYGPYEHMTYEDYLSEGGGERSVTNAPYLQAAFVAMDADSGYVRALVGGRDFRNSEFNRATQAARQPGSAFKPFVYTAAIRSGRPASHIVNDEPLSLLEPTDSMPWEPVNFEGDFRGPMTLRRGIRLSRNLVAIQLGLELGIEAVRGEALRFGLSTRLPSVNSLSIGSASVIPLEMVSAYSAFANLGVRSTPIGIVRVEDEQGNIVLEPQVRRDQILDEESAWIMTSMLQDVVNRGTARSGVRDSAGFRHPAGGKTGTTNDGRDVWFIGFTSELVAAVWIGFDVPRRIKAHSSGGRLAAPAWGRFMRDVYERRPAPAAWERPTSLVMAEIDGVTGYLATEYCPGEVRYFEWFIPGTVPKEFCPIHTRRTPGSSSGEDRPSGRFGN